MRIGFLDRSDPSWTAGASYSRSMLSALVSVVASPDEACVIGGAASAVSSLPGGVRHLSLGEGESAAVQISRLVADESIDVLLPVTEILLPDTGAALVGWIPDFQHRHLPHYFTDSQRAQRDRYFAYLVGNCDAMMFSSKAVLADFQSLYPSFSGPAGVAHFASSFAYKGDVAAGDPRVVLGKYGLPPAFVLVANQFWKHKNHRLVVEAVAQARLRCPQVHVVMVGMLSDSRDVSNSHLSEMVRRGCTERLFDHVTVLGEVPFPDLVALIRCAIEIIQPSEFEGWNTTVEDALALGKRVACSDIATHREQAPGAFFFPPDEAGTLAEHLAGQDWSQGGWGGPESERAALEAERARGAEWARGLVDFARVAVEAFRRRGTARHMWIDPVEEFKSNPHSYIAYLEAQVARLTEIEAVDKEREEKLEKRGAIIAELSNRIKADRVRYLEMIEASKKDVATLRTRLEKELIKPLRARVIEEVSRVLGRRSK